MFGEKKGGFQSFSSQDSLEFHRLTLILFNDIFGIWTFFHTFRQNFKHFLKIFKLFFVDILSVIFIASNIHTFQVLVPNQFVKSSYICVVCTRLSVWHQLHVQRIKFPVECPIIGKYWSANSETLLINKAEGRKNISTGTHKYRQTIAKRW